MNKQDIKRVIERLEPDDGMEYRLAEKLRKDFQRKIPFKPLAAIAAGLLIIIGMGVLTNYQIDNYTNAKSSIKNSNGDLNSLLALLPDSKVTQNPAAKSQDDSADNSSAPLPESKAAGNSEVISPESGAESSKDTLPKNNTNSEPQKMAQNNLVESPKALLGESLKAQNNEGIYIPRIQLPGNTQTTAKMKGLIVYQGRIYVQDTLQIDSKSAEKLIGEKLGTTKGTITEGSSREDYAVDLASTVGTQDVYTAKGYDKNFRIMAYEKIDGETYAYIYDCLNDITVNTGQDIFGKFKIENNVASVNYEDFDSWNNGMGNYKLLSKLDGFNNFLAALEDSIPYDQEGLFNLFADRSSTDQKFIAIKLNDGSEVQLRLFKGGYVYFNDVNIFFKVDSPAFNGFWNQLY